MREVPRQPEYEKVHPGASECPEIDNLPYPTLEEHLQNDRELDLLLRQLRPAEMLIAFDAMLCLVMQLYQEQPVGPGSYWGYASETEGLRMKQATLDNLRRVRARFLHPFSGEQQINFGSNFPPYNLPFLYEQEMGELQQAVNENKRSKTKAANYIRNHPSDVLRMGFPFISALESYLPRKGLVHREMREAQSQWRAVVWLLEELKRRLAYRRFKGLQVQGPPVHPDLPSLEGEGGVGLPRSVQGTPGWSPAADAGVVLPGDRKRLFRSEDAVRFPGYPGVDVFRQRQLDPTIEDCSQSFEASRPWRDAIRVNRREVTRRIAAVLDRFRDPRLKWLAVLTMFDMFNERVAPPAAVLGLYERLRSRIAETPEWPGSWGPPRDINPLVVAALHQGSIASGRGVAAALAAETEALVNLNRIGLYSPDSAVRAQRVAEVVHSVALALGQKAAEERAYRTNASHRPDREEAEMDMLQYLACWEDRLQRRFAFRDASTATVEGPDPRMQRIDPVDPDCTPSHEMRRTWRRADLGGEIIAQIRRVMESLHAARAKWLAVKVLMDMVESRIELPHPLQHLLVLAQQRMQAHPQWPPRWSDSEDVRRSLRVAFDAVWSERDPMGTILRYVLNGLHYLLEAPIAREDEDGPFEAERIYQAIERLSRALGWQAMRLETDRYGIPETEVTGAELARDYLACWQQRVEERLAFRDAGSADLDTVRGIDYTHPTERTRFFDPTDEACSPSEKEVARWEAWIREAGPQTATISQILGGVHSLRAVWLLASTAIDMAAKRLVLPEALQQLVNRVQSLIGSTSGRPEWTRDQPAWTLRPEDEELVRAATESCQTRTPGEPCLHLTHGLSRILQLQAHGPFPYAQLALGIFRVLEAASMPRYHQQEVQLADHGTRSRQALWNRNLAFTLACWIQRAEQRLAFREPHRDEIEYATVSGRKGPDWGRTYTAQVVHTHTSFGSLAHLKIQRRDGKEIKAPWQVLQQIKNDMLGEDVKAVEVFPEEDKVVNEVNMRHLWSVPQGLLPDLM